MPSRFVLRGKGGVVRGIVVAFFVLSAFFGVSALHAQSQSGVTVLDLTQQIQGKKSSIADLKAKISQYEKNIRARRAEKASLENELAIIEDSVNKKILDIEALQIEIDQLQLEGEQAALQIEHKDAEIRLLKQRLSEFFRVLYENSQRDTIEIFFLNENFSDFYDAMRSLESVQYDIKESLDRIQELRDQLQVHKSTVENNRERREELMAELNKQKESLDENRQYKQQLIVQSVLSADRFQDLLNQARRQQAEIDSDIARLELKMREALRLRGRGEVSLGWPVSPARGISAYFYDKTYPYRYVFEHPAIDIRAYQGTEVRAAEDGYVGRAKDNGLGYSYIMILHDKGLATVYGHISRILVAQDSYVQKGQIIGLSGGSPGTRGAGPFTTGPHLHFEVRVNGIPDDPLKYLP